MILKIMEGSDAEFVFDDHPSRRCRVVSEVIETNLTFNENNRESTLYVTYKTPNRGLLQEEFILSGNAYLMNDSGKTIQTFTPRV